MISQSFIEGQEYQAFKQILFDELKYKPLKIKTDGKTNEMIAREVTAYEIGAKLVEKAIKRFERGAVQPFKESKKFI